MRGRRKVLTDDSLFDAFWAQYPKTTNKPGTRLSWERALKEGATPAEIMAGLAVYPFGEDPRYWPISTTWLNQERWKGIKISAPPTMVVEPDKSRTGWRDRYDSGAGMRVGGAMAGGQPVQSTYSSAITIEGDLFDDH